MLSNQEFVRQSLELHLFFLRIMKEHSFFLEAGFTPKNSNLSREAEGFKNEFTRLLTEAVSLADGNISPEVMASGEVVTPYTEQAERASQEYTGIAIDINLTRMEESLARRRTPMNMSMLVQRVAGLNQRAIAATTAIANFKGRLLRDILSCRLFTANYPLLIDHIRREALLYINLVTRLQNREVVDLAREAVEQEAFWNRIMAEHAKFIRGLLDPTEVQLFNTADNFGKEFDELTREALAANDQAAQIHQVTENSLRATEHIRDFKRQGTEGLIQCKIRSIILPLLGDHTLREASHYLRLLRIFEARV